MWSPFLVITVPPLATLTPDDETVTRGRWDDRQWNRDRSRPTDWHGNRSKIIIPIPCATWSVRLSIVPHSIPSLSLRPAQRSDWGTRERVTEEWAQRTEGTSGPGHMPSFFQSSYSRHNEEIKWDERDARVRGLRWHVYHFNNFYFFTVPGVGLFPLASHPHCVRLRRV